MHFVHFPYNVSILLERPRSSSESSFQAAIATLQRCNAPSVAVRIAFITKVTCSAVAKLLVAVLQSRVAFILRVTRSALSRLAGLCSLFMSNLRIFDSPTNREQSSEVPCSAQAHLTPAAFYKLQYAIRRQENFTAQSAAQTGMKMNRGLGKKGVEQLCI